MDWGFHCLFDGSNPACWLCFLNCCLGVRSFVRCGLRRFFCFPNASVPPALHLSLNGHREDTQGALTMPYLSTECPLEDILALAVGGSAGASDMSVFEKSVL